MPVADSRLLTPTASVNGGPRSMPTRFASLTVKSSAPDTPPVAAVILTVPGLTPLTTPPDTLAMEGSDDVHVALAVTLCTIRPPAVVASAVNCVVTPRGMRCSPLTETESTGSGDEQLATTASENAR